MEYVRPGHASLEVPELCLGCTSDGASGPGSRGRTPPAEESRPFIRQAPGQGINFLDTAGRVPKDFARREEVMISTKVRGRMRPGPDGAGLSRQTILAEFDAGLKHPGMDHFDLCNIHRCDYGVPIGAALATLDWTCSGLIPHL